MMKRWKVTYQAVPYNYTTPGVLLIEAETPAEAFAVAYDALTNRGLAVYPEIPGNCGIDAGEVQKLGVPGWLDTPTGNVHIRRIEEHKVNVQGRVIG